MNKYISLAVGTLLFLGCALAAAQNIPAISQQIAGAAASIVTGDRSTGDSTSTSKETTGDVKKDNPEPATTTPAPGTSVLQAVTTTTSEEKPTSSEKTPPPQPKPTVTAESKPSSTSASTTEATETKPATSTTVQVVKNTPKETVEAKKPEEIKKPNEKPQEAANSAPKKEVPQPETPAATPTHIARPIATPETTRTAEGKPEIKPFAQEQRTQAIKAAVVKEVTERAASTKKATIIQEIQNETRALGIASTSNELPRPQSQSTVVLRSTIEQIQLLVQAESKTTTPITVESRPLADAAPAVVETTAPNQTSTSEPAQPVDTRITERSLTLDTLIDSDGDGISDYDEIHIYHTDPYNAHTSGSALTDGERLALGLDVHSKSPTAIAAQAPQASHAEASNLLTVEAIKLIPAPVRAVNATTTEIASATSTHTATSAGTSTAIAQSVPAAGKSLSLAGHALPNSFVTLYIFSTPIVVTVKADASGVWHYTLTKDLENGNHVAYAAVLDDRGSIIARSPAIPFVKRAEAVDFTPMQIPTDSTVSFATILQQNVAIVALIGFFIFGILAVMILGMRTIHIPVMPTLPPTPPTPPTTPPTAA